MTGLRRERALAGAGFRGGRRKSGGKPQHSTKERPAPEGGPYKGRKKNQLRSKGESPNRRAKARHYENQEEQGRENHHNRCACNIHRRRQPFLIYAVSATLAAKE